MEAICSIGKFDGTDCLKLSYIKTKGLVPRIRLSDDEVEVILLRCKDKMKSEQDFEFDCICYHHKRVYLEKHSLFERKCCDPFGRHKVIM